MAKIADQPTRSTPHLPCVHIYSVPQLQVHVPGEQKSFHESYDIPRRASTVYARVECRMFAAVLKKDLTNYDKTHDYCGEYRYQTCSLVFRLELIP